MSLGMILAGVPTGWNEGENARMKRLLEQQDFDTSQRQAPLRDDLLRAQAQHLRMAGAQAGQRRADENATNLLYWKALNAQGGVAPSLQPGPMGGAPQPPQQPQMPMQPPQQASQMTPVPPGVMGQTPFMAAAMPQSTQSQPLQGMGAGMGMAQPQPGPMGNAPQPPQPPAQDPFDQAIQQRQQALQQLRSIPPTPQIAAAGMKLDDELRQLQQAKVLQQIKLDAELRHQQSLSETVRRHGTLEDQGNRRLDISESSQDLRRELATEKQSFEERKLDVTTRRSMFDSEASRIRSDQLLTQKQKDDKIQELRELYKLPGSSKSNPFKSDDSQHEFMVMVASKLGIKPEDYDKLTPEQEAQALKSLSGTAIRTKDGTTYKISPSGDVTVSK